MSTEKSHLEKTLESFNETWFDTILRYSLFVGAIYQLFCLGACIFLPPTEEPDIRDVKSEEPTSTNGKRHRTRKQEKKKRR